MLHLAGLVAILNELNPGLGDKIAEKFNTAVSNKVHTHFVEPFAKTYKHGLFNGLGIGFTSGIIISYASYKIYKKIYDLKLQNNKLQE